HLDVIAAPSTLSLHAALPIWLHRPLAPAARPLRAARATNTLAIHTMSQQSVMPFALVCRAYGNPPDVVCEPLQPTEALEPTEVQDRKSTRLNSSHVKISYAVF